MELTVNEQGVIQIEKLFNGVTLKTPSGEILSICMRDSGFEFIYQEQKYSAQNGVIKEIVVYENTSKEDEVLTSPGNSTLVAKIIEASNKISKNRKPDADRIFLTEEYIAERAAEIGVSVDEMCNIIQNELL